MPTTRMMASPLGEGDRPIGLMLIGKHWQESTLYRAADVFERAGDW
jgi:amidase